MNEQTTRPTSAERRNQVRAARRAANLIGGTDLLCLLVNILMMPFLMAKTRESDGSSAYMVQEIVLYLIIFFLPYYLVSRKRGWTLGGLLGRGKPPAKVYLMVICLAIGWNMAATFASAGIELFLNQFGLTEGAGDYVEPITAAAWALQLIQIAVLPPFVEELCYRGFYQREASRSIGTWYAILLSSTAFWMTHKSLTILPLAFGFGILGGVLRERYQSLLPSICAHFVINSTYLAVNHIQQTMSLTGQYAFAAVKLFIECGCLIAGIVMASRMGLFRAIAEMKDEADERSGRAILCGVLTSIPFVIVVLTTIFFTGRSWKPL